MYLDIRVCINPTNCRTSKISSTLPSVYTESVINGRTYQPIWVFTPNPKCEKCSQKHCFTKYSHNHEMVFNLNKTNGLTIRNPFNNPMMDLYQFIQLINCSLPNCTTESWCGENIEPRFKDQSECSIWDLDQSIFSAWTLSSDCSFYMFEIWQKFPKIWLDWWSNQIKQA